MKKYKFSVIMAIYNVEKYLQEAIESVINQTIGFDNIQLILVNDGSPDNSEKICLKYKSVYPENIIYIKKENGGVSSARNAGLKVASGEIINFLDSDDYFSENAFEKVYDFFTKEKKAKVVAINLINFENSCGSWINKDYFEKTQLIDMCKEYSFMQCQVGASFIKTNIATKLEFDTNIKIHEDSHYLYRIFKKYPFCGTISDATYYHRIRFNGNSATQTIKHKNNIFDINEKVFIPLIRFYDYKPKNFLQIFILNEFNYYVLNKIKDCKFTFKEKEIIKKEIKYILRYIDEEYIIKHNYLSESDKKNILNIKSDGNIDYIFKQQLLKRYIKKLLIYIKQFFLKLLKYFPRKIKRRMFLDTTNTIKYLEKNINDIKGELIELNNNIEIKNELHELNQKYEFIKNKTDFLNKNNKKELEILTNQISEINEHMNILGNTQNNYFDILKSKINVIGKYISKEKYISAIKRIDKSFKPLISVIIPVYNGTNYIEKAIRSVLNQTYTNIEIIIVDDGSEDSSELVKIINNFNNDKIHYFKKENGGVSSALNYGINIMKGEYFSWLSHDDMFMNNHLEAHVNYISTLSDKKAFTYSYFKIIDENDNVLIRDTEEARFSCNNYFYDFEMDKLCYINGEINGCNVLIHKSIFEKCGLFNESLKYTQEKDMWNRISKKYKIYQIPLETTYLRVHDKTVTSKITDNSEIISTIIKIIKSLSNEEIEKYFGTKKEAYDYFAFSFGRSRFLFDIEQAIRKEFNDEKE